MLTQRDVVVDPVLSNVSIKFSNTEFIADRIMPILRTKKQTGVYYTYDKSNFRRDTTLRAGGSPANEVEFGLSTSSFVCQDHALKEFVDDLVRDQADAPLNPMIDATENLTEKMMIDREKTLAVTMADTALLTQNTTLSGTDQWSDYINSDPITDVRTARTSVHTNSFKKPNVMVMSKEVFDILADHPQIIERIKYSQLGVITEELMARVFQVERILVGEAGENTATEGATDVLAYIWGKHAQLVYVSPRVGIKVLTFGITFTYKSRQVKRWRDEDREGTFIRVGQDNYVQTIIALQCAYLIKNAVA